MSRPRPRARGRTPSSTCSGETVRPLQSGGRHAARVRRGKTVNIVVSELHVVRRGGAGDDEKMSCHGATLPASSICCPAPRVTVAPFPRAPRQLGCPTCAPFYFSPCHFYYSTSRCLKKYPTLPPLRRPRAAQYRLHRARPRVRRSRSSPPPRRRLLILLRTLHRRAHPVSRPAHRFRARR